MIIRFKLNGEEKIIDIPATKRAIDLLREDFGLLKNKASCYQGACGNCSVLIDDRIVSSCSILAFDLRGRSVVTAEGFMKTEEYQRINHLFQKNQYDPCDFCRWGKIFAIHEFLHSEERIDGSALTHALKGNQCNCTSPTLLLSVAEQIVGAERKMNAGRQHERSARK